ncbi:MAG: trypsin-like peptidase domain-containing protein [Butyrivibrio sp.]|uniref:S1C family serine protease n=1 Tax=Butyrivibrio sp. TaxID=28121 RepID=UPI0025E52AAC|nr:trypsin-like peptidase domain-containing protein [Butyrivibrio sp.]MCR5773276.1 trypsin-like peptidase domain-containing protein [Butyrivibrio sp.]
MNENENLNEFNAGNNNEPVKSSDNIFTENVHANESEIRKANTTDKKAKKKTKAKGKKAGKVVGAIALAAVFGVCTGAGIYGAQNFTSLSLNDTSTASYSIASTQTDSDSSDSQIKVTTTSNTQVVTTDVTSVVAAAMPSIVSINVTATTTTTDFFGQSYQEESEGAGSGIIIAKSDTELIIVTNNHVVEGANSMEVSFVDGSTATAYLKGTESSVDIAVIAVELEDLSEDTLSSISIATLGDSDALTVGESAIAIGNALGYGQSVTTGVISALDREIETEDGETNTFIQTDAAINPGNSGGALLNSNGEVIGVTSSKIGATTVEGMGFAIPISDVIDLINDLMNEETKITVAETEKGALGVSVMTPTGIDGAYVAAVSEGSAAEKAGIEVGDLITSFDGNDITSASDLTSIMSYYAEGDKVTVTVLRRVDGQYQYVDLEVTLDNASELTSSSSSESEESQTYEYGLPGQSGSESGQSSESEQTMPEQGSGSQQMPGNQQGSQGSGSGFSFGG